jgi:hypothetical protein
MSQSLEVYAISVDRQDLFTVEILDERPVGFSACVPELAIYTFGKTKDRALRRVFTHVVEKYQDLLNSPIPLNENFERKRAQVLEALSNPHHPGPGRIKHPQDITPPLSPAAPAPHLTGRL